MVECGECGSLIPEASKRCPKCGTIFETGTAKCSECGAWIPANATECPECHAKFLNVPSAADQTGSYDEMMKKQYDEYVNGFRQQAMAALGAKYSEDKFQEWLKTEPGFLTYDAWLKKVEEDKKQGAFLCPACGTPNPRGSTICHKCGSVFAAAKSGSSDEKPRTFRKIVKREKKEDEDEKKPPENQ
jgi:ribosomal protein L40E